MKQRETHEYDGRVWEKLLDGDTILPGARWCNEQGVWFGTWLAGSYEFNAEVYCQMYNDIGPAPKKEKLIEVAFKAPEDWVRRQASFVALSGTIGNLRRACAKKVEQIDAKKRVKERVKLESELRALQVKRLANIRQGDGLWDAMKEVRAKLEKL